MAHRVRDKKLTEALFFFFLLVPLPALLVGYWQIAFFAVLLAFIYILLNPTLMMPNKAELDLMIRAGDVVVVERSGFRDSIDCESSSKRPSRTARDG
ncbi:unnamed protein product [Sphagnum jensenii]|uniref:Uncharacterized protein n=1 Tax=Sphagnum jensenii TaxID=128206 RepID=A0ABP0VEW2_9BRYO